MTLLLEAKSLPASIIKTLLILVTHMDDLGWYITSNQQRQMFVQNLNRIVSRPNVTPGQILYCTTDSKYSLDSLGVTMGWTENNFEYLFVLDI